MSDEPITIVLNDRELGTILAALWEWVTETDQDEREDNSMAGCEYAALDDGEIENLRARLHQQWIDDGLKEVSVPRHKFRRKGEE